MVTTNFIAEAGTGVGTTDLVIIIVYLIGIMTVGIWAGYRKRVSSTQFFLAGRALPWAIIAKLKKSSPLTKNRRTKKTGL